MPTWWRIILAIVILAVYDNLIKLASGYAKLGNIDPALSLWGACLMFNALGLWVFIATPGQGARGIIPKILHLIGSPRRTPPGIDPPQSS